jgi:hypothetical protein
VSSSSLVPTFLIYHRITAGAVGCLGIAALFCRESWHIG